MVRWSGIYSEAALGVADGKLKTIEQILKGFSTLPNDAAFEYAFSTASISKANLARYYLRALESGTGDVSMELVPSEDTHKVNLEHVLPITPAGKWLKEWDADDAKAYYKRLGNLAIFSSKANSIMGNNDFETKALELKKSAFKLTKSISKFKKWDKSAINDRQMQMAKIAVKLWPY